MQASITSKKPFGWKGRSAVKVLDEFTIQGKIKGNLHVDNHTELGVACICGRLVQLGQNVPEGILKWQLHLVRQKRAVAFKRYDYVGVEGSSELAIPNRQYTVENQRLDTATVDLDKFGLGRSTVRQCLSAANTNIGVLQETVAAMMEPFLPFVTACGRQQLTITTKLSNRRWVAIYALTLGVTTQTFHEDTDLDGNDSLGRSWAHRFHPRANQPFEIVVTVVPRGQYVVRMHKCSLNIGKQGIVKLELLILRTRRD
jgi:hypothetical protein